MKHLEEVKKILEMERLTRTGERKNLFLSQKKYVMKVLERFGILNMPSM